MVGLNLLKWVFDVEVEDRHIDMMLEFNRITGPIALGLKRGSEEEAEDVKAIYTEIKQVLRETAVGKNFMDLGLAKGMDMEERLHELVAVFLFAGFGGTSVYVQSTVERIRRDPDTMVPLYLNDKVAFLKESARLAPPVGGLLGRSGQDGSFVLTDGDFAGQTLEYKKGDEIMLWIPTANKDPNVFGGPEKSIAYAYKFDPTRENLNKIMTWNGDLEDIERGWAPPGTEGHAPRHCPGAIVAIQLCEKLVDFFLPQVGQTHQGL